MTWRNHRKSLGGLSLLVLVWFLPRPREILIWLADHVAGDRMFHWLKAQVNEPPGPDLASYGTFISVHWYQIISGVFVGWLVLLGTAMCWESRSVPPRSMPNGDADRYSVKLDHGYSLLVKWRNLPLVSERQAARDEALGHWLSSLRSDIREHYGESTANRFNFPASVPKIGTDEPAEHEARLKELARIIEDIKNGPLRPRPRSRGAH